MSSALTPRGSTRAWRRVRLFVLMRDHYRCTIRGPRCLGTASTVDHVTPRELWPPGVPGVDNPDNLRAACVPCNSGAGAAIAARTRVLRPAPSRRW